MSLGAHMPDLTPMPIQCLHDSDGRGSHVCLLMGRRLPLGAVICPHSLAQVPPRRPSGFGMLRVL